VKSFEEEKLAGSLNKEIMWCNLHDLWKYAIIDNNYPYPRMMQYQTPNVWYFFTVFTKAVKAAKLFSLKIYQSLNHI